MIRDLRDEIETVKMLENRIATVNEDQLNMEKQIEEVESKYRNELSTMQIDSESSSREQVGRMARRSIISVQLQREIEEGGETNQISTEEIARLHKTLSMVRPRRPRRCNRLRRKLRK